MARPDPRRLDRLMRLARLRSAETRAAQAAAAQAQAASIAAESTAARVAAFAAAHRCQPGMALASELQTVGQWREALHYLRKEALAEAERKMREAEARQTEHARSRRAEELCEQHIEAHHRDVRRASLLAPSAGRDRLARNLKSTGCTRLHQDAES